MIYYDKTTGRKIGDTREPPFYLSPPPSREEINIAMERFILSSSGWRKVFARNGDEESREPEITAQDGLLIAAAAYVYGKALITRSRKEDPTVTIGLDTRPTGPVIGEIIVRVLLGMGLNVRYLFIAAAPEIMAFTKNESSIDGFIYVSASHNPVGHNGIKFGFSDGAVLGGGKAGELIDEFRRCSTDSFILEKCSRLVVEAEKPGLREVYGSVSFWKRQALEIYAKFAETVASGTGDEKKREDFFTNLRSSITRRTIGVVAELNGSARTVSIDEPFLLKNGIKVKTVNSVPGEIVHRIVPEGESLIPCRDILEQLWKTDPSFLFGYVPDCDGDRGNIVYMDEDSGKALELEAQEVFALACLSELAFLEYSGTEIEGGDTKTAVAVNGPTSMRIEAIAEAFGAEVFRAEVGEANVVHLAAQLRHKGYTVRILGEGSNGGNITHPSTVRDPLNTLLSLIKLLRLPPGKAGKTLFQIWMEKKEKLAGGTLAGEINAYPGLKEIIASLPEYSTAGAFDREAALTINSTNHALLKEEWENIFLNEWEMKKEDMKERFGFFSWEGIQYEGTEEKRGFGKEFRSSSEKGGLKILFRDENKKPAGFLWMRGSGTEPVFRILAEYRGRDREKMRELLLWQRDMLLKADSRALNS